MRGGVGARDRGAGRRGGRGGGGGDVAGRGRFCEGRVAKSNRCELWSSAGLRGGGLRVGRAREA